MFGGEREPRITLARFAGEGRGEGPAVVRLTLTLSPTQKWWRGTLRSSLGAGILHFPSRRTCLPQREIICVSRKPIKTEVVL